MKSLLLIALSFISQLVYGQNIKQVGAKLLPSVTIFNLTGYKGSLPELATNKITFIDFWFIPCGPCSAEMGMLHKLYDAYKEDSPINFLQLHLVIVLLYVILLKTRILIQMMYLTISRVQQRLMPSDSLCISSIAL
jgi:thiol-disulfide isomerase/thioredoxin